MERVKIIQVRPIYREGNKVMDIRIHFPKTRIRPGDYFTLDDKWGEPKLTWSEWASKYIKKTIAIPEIAMSGEVEKEIEKIVADRFRAATQFPQEDKL